MRGRPVRLGPTGSSRSVGAGGVGPAGPAVAGRAHATTPGGIGEWPGLKLKVQVPSQLALDSHEVRSLADRNPHDAIRETRNEPRGRGAAPCPEASPRRLRETRPPGLPVRLRDRRLGDAEQDGLLARTLSRLSISSSSTWRSARALILCTRPPAGPRWREVASRIAGVAEAEFPDRLGGVDFSGRTAEVEAQRQADMPAGPGVTGPA
jgi:hypothetical protein